MALLNLFRVILVLVVDGFSVIKGEITDELDTIVELCEIP